MRDYHFETERRVEFIKNIISEAGASGVLFGCSGGKDSALVAILCKMACDDTVGITLPCKVGQNFGRDIDDSIQLCEKYDIELRNLDLSSVKDELERALSGVTSLSQGGSLNIAPRLRMTALYAIAGSENRLVVGTSNKSERYVGYFTKWGDGASDFNPIADLTATEVFEFLRFLKAPLSIIEKAPSAALKEGQTDEGEMGFSYDELDGFLSNGTLPKDETMRKIERLHRISEHKRLPIKTIEDR